MFYNNSYKEPKLEQQLNQLMGAPYSIWYRLKNPAIGSSFLQVHEFRNFKIKAFDTLRTEHKKIVLEQRPKGIIVHFKINHDTFIWGIPYYQLHFYNTNYFSIHAQGKALLIEKDQFYARNLKYLKRIMELRSLV